MTQLVHVTTRSAWTQAQSDGRITAPAGAFIHLCTQAQLPFVLNRHFAGRTELLALHVDTAGLDLRWEQSEPDMPPFPHLYEDLPTTRVQETRQLTP